MPDPADPIAIAGSGGETALSSPRRARRSRDKSWAGWRGRPSPEAASRWALALFWASAAFAVLALALLVSSFFD